MRLRRATAAVGTAAPLVALAVVGQVGPAGADDGASRVCQPTIVALPLPPGTTNGDVLSATTTTAVGYVADDAQHQSVAVWRVRDGRWRVQDLGDFGISEQFSGLSATGVNARGDVAIGVNTDVMGAWLLRNGVVHRLRDFAGGTNAYARGINDRGEVVGEALDAAGADYGALWTSWRSAPVRLAPTTGYDGSFAQGVNDRGQVVGGSFSNGPQPTLPVRWASNGSLTELETLGGDGQAFDINAAGRSVGYSLTPGGQQRAVVWSSAGRVRDLGVFPGSVFSRAIGVSVQGYVVGFEGVNPTPPTIPVRHVLLWPGYGPARSLLPLSLSWADGAYAHAVDNSGDVFGASAATAVSLPRPTEWTCALEQSFVPAAVSGTTPAVRPLVRLAGRQQGSRG